MIDRRSLWPVGALLVFGLLYSAGYLELASRWWFEDDPSQYAFVSTIQHPLAIFTDPAVLKGMASGTATIPMQTFSYWIDVRLAGFSPRFAYAHQGAAFLLALLMLYLLLVRWLGGNRLAALAMCVCWALTPSTAVVVQFLATRHYVEGLLFTLLAVYLAERLRGWKLPVAGVCGLIAMLSKEVYVPVVPLLLVALAWRRKDRVLGATSVGVALFYAAFRWWLFGWSARFGDMPFLTPWQYVKFLSKLPYTVSSNYGGYLLVALVVATCVYVVRRNRAHLPVALLFSALIVVSLAAIVPVSYPLYGMIRRPDPWYRIVFLLHTIGIVFAAWCASQLPWRWARAGLAAVTLAVLLPGAVKTRNLWHEMNVSAEREAMFYLGNPDKILLSEQEAYWFIPGVTWMYKISEPHYVLARDLATARIRPGAPVWAWRDGRFRPICTSSPDSGDLKMCR